MSSAQVGHENSQTVLSRAISREVTSVLIPHGTYAIGAYCFAGCNKLEICDLGAQIKSIGANAFLGAASLGSIKIPASVMSIGVNAFSGCTSLNTVEVCDKACSTVRGMAGFPWGLTNCIFVCSDGRMKQNGTVIEPFPTYSGDVVYTLEIEEGKTVIDSESDLIEAPENATRIVIPEGITTINGTSDNKSPFRRFTSLEQIDLPSTLTTIGDYAFNNCPRLDGLWVPNTVTSIGPAAFNNQCANLTTLVFSGRTASVVMTMTGFPFGAPGWTVFYCSDNVLYAKTVSNTTTRCEGNGYCVVFGTTEITEGEFARTTIGGEEGLKKVYAVPPSVEKIGVGAFRNDSDLFIYNNENRISPYPYIDRLFIPYGVKEIGDRAFKDSFISGCDADETLRAYITEKYKNIDAIDIVRVTRAYTDVGSITVRYRPNTCLEGRIYLPDSITSIGEEAFCHEIDPYILFKRTTSGKSFGRNDNGKVCEPLEIRLPRHLLSLSSGAFKNVNPLQGYTNISDLASMTSIGYEAMSLNFSEYHSWVGRAEIQDPRYDFFEKTICLPTSVSSVDGHSLMRFPYYIKKSNTVYSWSGYGGITSIVFNGPVPGVSHVTSGIKLLWYASKITFTGLTKAQLYGQYKNALSSLIANIDEDGSYNGSMYADETWVSQCEANAVEARYLAGRKYIVASDMTVYTDGRDATVTQVESGTTEIKAYRHKYDYLLKTISLPDTVRTIGDQAFFMAVDVTGTITLPANLVSIGEKAFYYCGVASETNISVTLGQYVRSVGAHAFGSVKIRTLNWNSQTMAFVRSLANYPFGLSSGSTIVCADGTITTQ